MRWIEEWLKDRSQRVVIQGEYSDWLPVTSGVPQGSVLGPVLFLIYINDLDDSIINWILKFADDTKLFGKSDSDHERKTLQKDLENLSQWATDWQMQFNVAKCKVMHLGNSNIGQKYFMNGKELESIDEELDLGLKFNKDLKCSTQTNHACTKAQKTLGMISRAIVYKDIDIMLSLYKTLVRPLVEYCTPAWAPHYQKDKDKLERVQHRFTRMIPELRKLPYEDRLKKLNLWSLEERRNRTDLIEVFKIFTKISKVPFDTFFEINPYQSTRGHHIKLRKHLCNKDLRRFFFSERIIERWNNLDEKCVTSTSLNQFKTNLTRLRNTRMGFFED